MVGRIHLSPKPTPPPPARRRSSRRRRPTKKRGRKTRHVFDDLFGLDDLFDYSDYSDYSDIMVESATRTQEYTPVQNVYFFKRGENPWSHFCLLVVLKTEATRIKHILCNLLPFCFFSRRQINTTEWIWRRNAWTPPDLLTHDPLRNTGWAVRARTHLTPRGQRRDRREEKTSHLLAIILKLTTTWTYNSFCYLVVTDFFFLRDRHHNVPSVCVCICRLTGWKSAWLINFNKI